MDTHDYDVLVVGAGPAGLSATLILGRCCRRVLLLDSGQPRNAASRGVHGFLSREGILPADLRRIGREQLAPYENVEVRDVEVVDAQREGNGFVLKLADGTEVRGRKLLLATGLVDELPPIPGMRTLWGRGVYPCPYCDAWELRGKRLGVYGRGPDALAMTRALTVWSADVRLFTDGGADISAEDEAGLAGKGIEIIREPVTAFQGIEALERVTLTGRNPVPRDAVFVSSAQYQRSLLVTRLGCALNPKGRVDTGEHESTDIPGLFVAGDASGNVQFAIIAAAEGAEAAFAINRSLVRESFSLD